MVSNYTKSPTKPLEELKILEYGIFHAGPGAGAILGDLGAHIIKIEIGSGDPMRKWTSVGGNSIALPNGESVLHEIANRNKKGIWLDIKTEKGRAIFNQLLKVSDVFLTNLRQSTKMKMKLDYASLSKENPRLIHANVTGYGENGPASDSGAFDPLGQARSGMMFVTGSSEPALIQNAVIDQATSIALSHAILTALYVRERSGIGQEIHASLYSTALWLLYPNLMMSSLLPKGQSPLWERSRNSPLRNYFCCNDGKWIMGVHHPEEKYWRTFCEATGQLHLTEDPRYKDSQNRQVNCPELINIFDKVFAEKPSDEWIEILLDNGLMFSPVQQVNEVFTDPQARANDYVVDFDHPSYGKLKIPGYPLHFSANTAGTTSPAPAVGQHTKEILNELGYSDPSIRQLEEEGIVRLDNT